MQFLSSGPEDPNQGLNQGPGNQDLIPSDGSLFQDAARQAYVVPGPGEEPTESAINPLGLLRKYWMLLLALTILGAAGGFMSVVLSAPRYRAKLMMEVQSSNVDLTKIGAPTSGSDPDYEVTIQTQIGIMNSGTFLKRGAERMQSDAVPLAPTGRDIFSRLRQRIRPATQDPLEAARVGLNVAMMTFDARPVVRTRLMELTCESTSPDVAAQFLNAMAAEFSDDGSRSRMQTAQHTSEWLAAQIEETKAKVQEAEDHLQDYVRSSGNVFAGQAGQDVTLEDTRLMELKGALAKIQIERAARQTRYELTLKNPPESLAEVLDDPVLKNYQGQMEDLKRQKAVLETVYTAKHEKVQKIDAQIASVQKAYEAELTSVVRRIKNDYDASVRQEKLLNGNYEGQSQRVGSEAGKAAQYNSLKREVETQRTMYQNLLVKQSEANMSSSVPINPVRVVEAAVPSETPYTPRPVLNIAFGTMIGIALTGGLVFLSERLDSSIKSPGGSRRMFNAPELGVIPNLGPNANGVAKTTWRGIAKPRGVNGHEDPATALATWQSGPAFIAESFRGTLASILRNQATGKTQKIIMITSPGPAEGKTTVVQNLGIALAETGRRVLLVDADFRRPHLHREFSLPNEWGLIDLLLEDQPLSEYPTERLGAFTGLPGLSILANRVTENNVSKALYSPRLRTILESLTKHYDMVLVDAPPLLSVADARIIAPLTDALILVLRSGVTNRESAMEAYQRIQEDGLTLLGTVLTDYNLSGDRKRRYYYDYGSPSQV